MPSKNPMSNKNCLEHLTFSRGDHLKLPRCISPSWMFHDCQCTSCQSTSVSFSPQNYGRFDIGLINNSGEQLVVNPFFFAWLILVISRADCTQMRPIYGIFTYIYHINVSQNVGKYSIHTAHMEVENRGVWWKNRRSQKGQLDPFVSCGPCMTSAGGKVGEVEVEYTPKHPYTKESYIEVWQWVLLWGIKLPKWQFPISVCW